MRHQNDACPSPSSGAAAPITTTSRLPRPRSNLEILNSTQMSSSVAADQQQQQQYHRCCRQLANRDKSPSEQHHHHHYHQYQPALETAAAAAATSSLLISGAQSVVDRKQDTRLVQIMTIAAASSIKVESGDKCGDRADSDRYQGGGDATVNNLHQGQRLSRKRKRAKTCSTRDYSATESLPIETSQASHDDDDDDSVFDDAAAGQRDSIEKVMTSPSKIKLEPLTPVQSPAGQQTTSGDDDNGNGSPISDEDSIQLTMSPPMTPLSASELDETTTTATTTTTTTPHHPTNHQRQASSIERTNQQQQHLINRVNHRQQQQQNLPEKITEAQLDRLNTLIKIIRQGSYNEFTELLAERTFKNILNVFVDGHTALHYSLIYGRSLAWCKQLVSNGANPNLTNRAGWHPIHLAAFNGSRETMRYLIDCIAN